MGKLDKNEENFFEQFKSEKIDEDQLRDAEKKASNLGDLAMDFLTMVDLVKDAITGDFKIKTSELAVLIGAIIYVISPIDAIPDILPVVGWVDDIAVVGFVLFQLKSLVERYKSWRGE
ncbi:MAG: YkvA family protein [Treponemataceae bacterium]